MDVTSSVSGAVALAALAALASAATFGLSSSLQHRVAGSTTSSEGWFLAHLARHPAWVVGLGLSGLAFSLHAAAIALGSLALVQPIIVTGIVFAVLARSAIDRRLPTRREFAWAGFTWAGLAVFVAAIHPGAARSSADETAAVFFVAVGAVVAAVAVRFARVAPTPERTGLWLGAAAGALFGLVAGLLKMAIAQAAAGPMHLLLHWSPWALTVVGLSAMTLNQRAYQATRLSVSMPVLNIVDVIVALSFASLVFGEPLASSPLAVAGAIAGLVAMGIGVSQLARQAPSDVPVHAVPPFADETAGPRWPEAESTRLAS